MNDKFLKLTDTVYRVLEFFPESDPLKNRAKDRALVVMEHLVLANENSGWASFQKEKIKSQILEDVDILLGYLWIGKSQGWLNSSNYLIISNEYEKIKKNIQPINIQIIEPIQKPKREPEPVLNNTEPKTPNFSISTRQRIIIEFLEKNEKGQVMDLQTVLPDITKRTIRRDLDELLNIGKIVRLGDFNQVFYKLA